jgi:hypothetical protein
MTIASTVTSQQFPCNGATLAFAFPNKVFSASDLVVTLIDTVGNQYTFANFTNALLGLTYQVFGVDVDSGCTVQFNANPTAGWTLDMRTVTPEVQSTSVKNQGAFLPELHEEFFDRITRELQDLSRLTYLFGIHGPDIETVVWPALPAASVRANKALLFDANGLPTLGVLSATTMTGAIIASLLTPDLIGSVLYPRHPVEIALGIVPTNRGYPVDPYLDPRRYGADPTNNAATAAATTTAITNAMTVAYNKGGTILIGFNCIYKINPILFLMTNSANSSLRIQGEAMIGCGFSCATPTSGVGLLGFSSSNPYLGNTMSQCYLALENFSMYGPGAYNVGPPQTITGTNNQHAIFCTGLSDFFLNRLRVTLFAAACETLSCIGVTIRECEFTENIVGHRSDFVGTFPTQTFTANLIRVENCIMSLNQTCAVQFNGGTHLVVSGCDMENNGSSTVTQPSTIWVQGQCSPDVQEGHVVIENNWLEGNNGWTIQADAQTNGCQMRIYIGKNDLFGAQSGQYINILGGQSVIIEDQQCAVTGTFSVVCNYGTFRNAFPATWVLTGVVVPVVENCGVGFEWGLQFQWTGTYIGVSGTVTNLVSSYLQGKEVLHKFTDVGATSNATNFGISGMPANLQPASTKQVFISCQDNGTDVAAEAVVNSGSGTIGFGKLGASGWTATGTKGVRASEMRYRLTP